MSKKEHLKFIPDSIYLRILYRWNMHRPLHMHPPKTFNEKLQWLKLHDRNPQYTIMVDKYAVKGWVAKRIGEQYIIPVLGVWDKFDDIDFSFLPDKFVLKCTHDCGGLVICKDKSTFDIVGAKEKLTRCLKRNYYWSGREWPYKNVPPRIFAEQYMNDGTDDIHGDFVTEGSSAVSNDLSKKNSKVKSNIEELKDYKFLCFGGKVKCIFTVSERFMEDGLKVTFFDMDWNQLPFERHYPKSNVPIPKPYNFNKMIELAQTLSENIPFVRVDFYESNRRVYFGEMTFYPGGGFEEFTPEEWDYTFGSWIDLSLVKKCDGK